MLVLGIDPGVNNLGISLIKVDSIVNKLYIIEQIHYTLTKNKNNCYVNLERDLSVLFLKYVKIDKELLLSDFFISNIDMISIEKPFFSSKTYANNIRTLEVIGIIKFLANKFNIEFIEYSPATIKKKVTGNGRADKQDIINSINKLFNITLKNNHIADATACALTYLIESKNSYFYD